ncbi:MAG TPA: AraC family transcriptional regulator [Candidatus Eisenbergiella intestinipullorum]|nr:AraC family transcriptional regulator [Candidatus Eisenbergiella intestinipullorum]
MAAIRTSFMSGEDERQYMIREDYEIYEKYGAPTGATALHYHDFYELIYILDGEFSSLVDNVTYFLKKGDFLLIGRNVLHKYHFVEGKHARSRRIVLWITRQMLDRLSGGEQDLSRCFEREKGAVYHFPRHYEDVLHDLLVRAAMTEVPDLEGAAGKRLYDRAQLTLFFFYLNELCGKEAFSSREPDSVRHALVEQVNAYIEAHMQEPISLDELAEHAHMSKYYFLRRFKELTGTTVHAYLNNKRLIGCCELLQEGEPVGAVWGKCGFSDYSSFLRNFRKEYGMSPSRYKTYLGKRGSFFT